MSAQRGPRLVWDEGEAGFQPLGAMIDGLALRLPDGRLVEPLATAPWADEAGTAALPGILRRLRGEWPCVPFGTEDQMDLPSRWPRPTGEEVAPHGHGSNAVWTVRSEGEALVATIEYPRSSPVRRLRRTMRPRGVGVDLSLEIAARRDCRVPIALHAVLRLPETAGAARLDIAAHAGVWSHPAHSPSDPCPLAPDCRSPSLSAMLGADGGTIDLTALPLDEAAECRVLVPNASGRAVLSHLREGWQAVLEWDATDLPGLMLWISNRGRRGYPWNGRHLAIGVEPCRAAFDLGTAVSAAPNPLSQLMATALDLRAGETWRTGYRISARTLAG